MKRIVCTLTVVSCFILKSSFAASLPVEGIYKIAALQAIAEGKEDGFTDAEYDQLIANAIDRLARDLTQAECLKKKAFSKSTRIESQILLGAAMSNLYNFKLNLANVANLYTSVTGTVANRLAPSSPELYDAVVMTGARSLVALEIDQKNADKKAAAFLSDCQ